MTLVYRSPKLQKLDSKNVKVYSIFARYYLFFGFDFQVFILCLKLTLLPLQVAYLGWGDRTSRNDVSPYECSGTPGPQINRPLWHNVPGLMHPYQYALYTSFWLVQNDGNISMQGHCVSGTIHIGNQGSRNIRTGTRHLVAFNIWPGGWWATQLTDLQGVGLFRDQRTEEASGGCRETCKKTAHGAHGATTLGGGRTGPSGPLRQQLRRQRTWWRPPQSERLAASAWWKYIREI